MTERSTPSERSERRPNAFHQILILLFGALFFGGGEAESLAERVTDVVEDEARASSAVELAERAARNREERVNSFVRWRVEFYELLADPEVDRSDLGHAIDDLRAQLTRSERELEDLRFELADLLTEPEWNELFEDE